MKSPRFLDQNRHHCCPTADLLPALLAALSVLLLLACAAPVPTPAPPAAPAPADNSPIIAAPDTALPAPPVPQAFWDCVLQKRETWQSRSAPYQWLNSDASASIAAARACAASHLPPYDPANHPPEDGAALAACFDQERDHFLILYPEREALASADNFFLNGLNQVCYTEQRLPEFRFRNPENP